MRLFVSVDLPEAFADPIAAIQDELSSASGLKLTDPAQAHVTLQFLGEVDASRVDDVVGALERAVEAAALDPFDVRFGGLGVFPSREYISVVWVGVERGESSLAVLQEAVENRLAPLGFEGDDHEFTPHVTVGRMKHGGGKGHVQSIVDERSPTIGTMTVEELSLTESVLTAEGPRYRTYALIPLESDSSPE